MTMQPTDREKQLSDLMLAGGKRLGKSFEAGKQAGRQELINELIEWANEYLPISNFKVNSVIQDAKKSGGDEVKRLIRNKLNELKQC